MIHKYGIIRTAEFSPCRTWRYSLYREWNKERPLVTFVLLNPSTADELRDDPTNRRGLDYANRWGYGSCCFVNLFAYRTPYPEAMKLAEDPIGPENNDYIMAWIRRSERTILAWGNHGSFINRDEEVRGMVCRYNVWSFGYTKVHQPKHILYLRKDAPLMQVLT